MNSALLRLQLVRQLKNKKRRYNYEKTIFQPHYHSDPIDHDFSRMRRRGKPERGPTRGAGLGG